MKHQEYQYLDLMKEILENGNEKKIFLAPEVLKQYEEKGEQPPFIRSLFGRQTRYDLSREFPLLTTKKVFLRGIIHELLWFIRGDSNIKNLVDNDVHIWDEWPYKNYKAAMMKGEVPDLTQAEFIAKIKESSDFALQWGDLGNVYGVQWRRWKSSDGRTIDQLGWAINELKTNPFRKSIVVSAWNPEFIYAMAASRETAMAIPPCHTLFQFSVVDNKLSLHLYQRSADLFLGVPFNIASYALFTMMLAQVTGLQPGEFVHTFGDVHLYSNHIEQAKEQITREPKPFPKMIINTAVKNIDDFKYEDFQIEGYDPWPTLKGDITAVGGF
ncbi:MAG: thymidylate synthase [Candidatus Gracilibacteria bacterium]|nr:thymidylate synthase [Candidatus Gracilibacteria bacterium]